MNAHAHMTASSDAALTGSFFSLRRSSAKYIASAWAAVNGRQLFTHLQESPKISEWPSSISKAASNCCACAMARMQAAIAGSEWASGAKPRRASAVKVPALSRRNDAKCCCILSSRKASAGTSSCTSAAASFAGSAASRMRVAIMCLVSTAWSASRTPRATKARVMRSKSSGQPVARKMHSTNRATRACFSGLSVAAARSPSVSVGCSAEGEDSGTGSASTASRTGAKAMMPQRARISAIAIAASSPSSFAPRLRITAMVPSSSSTVNVSARASDARYSAQSSSESAGSGAICEAKRKRSSSNACVSA
mmetsp:Transcript_33711/g.104077  ORF Transcript_33711/g.104077 Transcript_33711/m.104077 type:complete len:308 (+) Transcript_33711:118-1041(+)